MGIPNGKSLNAAGNAMCLKTTRTNACYNAGSWKAFPVIFLVTLRINFMCGKGGKLEER
jgi:hypothetical protein